MNAQAFSQAKAAYQSGDWANAVALLAASKEYGEQWGEADHLRGNSLMKLGMYSEAANAYGEALQDPSYAQTHAGALNCNRGRALVAAGMPDAAVACFQAAVADATYPTPYKAYLALGNLYERAGQPREAGMAWRNAAIDEANPDPAAALVKLGGSFMALGRPIDAVEAYRTALDFSGTASQGAIYGELGLAYMAANRVAEAADAFTQATADGSYVLTPEQSAQLTAAQNALAAMSSGPSETEQLLSQAGYGTQGTGSFDPLDPMGKSGEFIPSPEDTGFFSVTEEDLMQADRDKRRARRKHSHRGRKVVAFIFVLLVICAGVGGFGYYKGYGWPTQESVVTDMFDAAASGSDVSGYLSSTTTDELRAQIKAVLPTGGTVKVSGVDRSMASSKVLATAQLSSGGQQNYTVTLVRDGISWKVSNVELSFAAQSTTTTGSLATSTTDAATDAATTDAATDEASTSESTPGEASNAATISASSNTSGE